MSQSRFLGATGTDPATTYDEEGRTPPSPLPDSIVPGGAPLPRGLRIRQQIRTAQFVLPGFAAAAATLWLGEFSTNAPIRAAVFGLVILAVSRLLRDSPYPLRLLPASRIAVALIPLAAGSVAVGALELAQDDTVLTGQLTLAFVLASVVAIAIEVIGDRLVAARPLRIAVLGAADFVPAIRRELDAIGGRREIEVIGWLNLGARYATDGRSAEEETLGRVRAAITEHDIDLLVRGPGSGSSRSGRDVYDTIAAGCLDLPVRMMDGNQLYEHVFGHVPIGTIDSAWFLFLMHPRFHASSKYSKRALDIAVGLPAALVALPLVALGAVAIKLGDRGPVFYRQTRVGERGREFEILKLRTMSVGAQAKGAQWSGANDERVTGVGKVLRRLHVDELPQIINVLRGDMTLVGPRPEQPQITAELESVFPHYSRRLLVKPGVTGWAQVRCGYAGSELGTAWKLCHDLFYLKHRSALIDLLIMLETVVIAARDSHRPMRAPQAEFLFRGVVGLDGGGVPTQSVGMSANGSGRIDDGGMPEIPLNTPVVRSGEPIAH
jgi:lipopolysaccharide/colanic/teichoic acid biosynthesis glycosyltransferase